MIGNDAANKTKFYKKNCKNGLEKQAIRMLNRSKQIIKPASLHDNILVNIDKVDKSQVNSPNLLCLIIDIKEHDRKTSYKCATRDCMLKNWLSRDQFDINKQKILSLESINADK